MLVAVPEGKMVQAPFNPTGTHYNQNSIDIAVAPGTRIGAPVTGKLLGSGMSSSYGGWAAFGSKQNPYLIYHLDKESIISLTDLEGTMYEIGQAFAFSALTGNVGDVPHIGIMAGSWWDQAAYDSLKAKRLTNDRAEWAFRQPAKSDEIAKIWMEIAEALRDGNYNISREETWKDQRQSLECQR
jgi:hypothetical protein